MSEVEAAADRALALAVDALREAIRAAVLLEREECAALCDAEAADVPEGERDEREGAAALAALELAAAIRART